MQLNVIQCSICLHHAPLSTRASPAELRPRHLAATRRGMLWTCPAAPVALPMEFGWSGIFKLALLWHDLHAGRTVKLTVSKTADLATLQIECESWFCSQTSILPRGRSGCVCRESETWHPGAREGRTKPQQCAEWSKARHT